MAYNIKLFIIGIKRFLLKFVTKYIIISFGYYSNFQNIATL